MSFLNITAYKFVSLASEELPNLKIELKANGELLGVRGTILLSEEGINLSLAGTTESIEKYTQYLSFQKPFSDLIYKESYSHDYPFTRMIVRIKKEIIKMNCPEIEPAKKTAPHLSPAEFKKWYEENKDMIVLDTRNDYEIEAGTFRNALNLQIHNFHEFPEAIKKLPGETKKKTIVTVCTGGVRCEKAAQLMLNEGFEEVYQLDGGILNYFAELGGDYYDGECFVFDKRITVDPKLQESSTTQCMSCRMPVTREYQACPHCSSTVLHPKADH
jgi:UPF0176 protein